MRPYLRAVAGFVIFSPLVLCALADNGAGAPDQPPSNLYVQDRVCFSPTPITLHLDEPGPDADAAGVTDVEVGDFDGDLRPDVAVAWYVTYNSDMSRNKRFLTIFFNQGDGTFERAVNLDLYGPNYDFPALSIFAQGTGEIGMGDFDGDGDLDLAVAPFWGDELWLIENRGRRTFQAWLKFPFGSNSPGNPLTSPELIAADFDGDGRQELVCLADPVIQIGARIIHFWKTTSDIAHMARVDWQAGSGAVFTKWTRGLAITDFDGDGRPDLCFTGCTNSTLETSPILVFWYHLNLSTRRFLVHNEYPGIVCSDVVDVPAVAGIPPGVILTDLDGTTMQYWRRANTGMTFSMVQQLSGYAGLSTNRGMTAVMADVDGDGNLDLITKQKLGLAANRNQIEMTLSAPGGAAWSHVSPSPIDTLGFTNDPTNEILRPRNLAVGDLLGNSLPDVVAGFGWDSAPDKSRGTLDVAIWVNGCLGDVNRDGQTDAADLDPLLAAWGASIGDPAYNPDADLDKDGTVGPGDLSLLTADLGCSCNLRGVDPPRRSAAP